MTPSSFTDGVCFKQRWQTEEKPQLTYLKQMFVFILKIAAPWNIVSIRPTPWNSTAHQTAAPLKHHRSSTRCMPVGSIIPCTVQVSVLTFANMWMLVHFFLLWKCTSVLTGMSDFMSFWSMLVATKWTISRRIIITWQSRFWNFGIHWLIRAS